MIILINLLVPGTKTWSELIKNIIHSNCTFWPCCLYVVVALFPLERPYFVGKGGFELGLILLHPPEQTVWPCLAYEHSLIKQILKPNHFFLWD